MHITFFKLFFIYSCIAWLIDVSFGLLYVNILGGNYKAAIFCVVLICMSFELQDGKALTNLGLIKMGIHQKE